MPEKTAHELRSIAKFQITRGQYLLAILALFSLIGMGVSFIADSNTTVEQANVLSDVETPAASIIFTQRETLVYATRLAQWSNGGIPRREVQIARNLLAQRLAVIDSSGMSMGERADTGYWSAIKQSDAIVAASQPGILPESDHAIVNSQLAPVIDAILAESRELVVDYQRSVDDKVMKNAQDAAQRERVILFFFYAFLLLSGIFLAWNARTNFKNYRIARAAIEAESQRLDETIAELRKAKSTVAVLKDLNEQKNSFISTVNHELRTPLTSIIGYIDVIREMEADKGSHEYDRYLDVVDRNAEILLHLVESILSLSKIDASEGRISRQRVSLSASVDNAVFILKPLSEKSNITIKISHDENDPCEVSGDVGQLNQVFLNLLGNAIKFSPANSTITISVDRFTKPSGIHYIRATISDEGIGIPEEDLHNLFTRFFRAKNAISDQYPGTGLGLTIVQQSIQNHGGFVEVQSTVGKGTTFTVLIPEFQSEEDQLINDRRESVLIRAIDHLREATSGELKNITHSMGGAIGFYGFEKEGEEVLHFSRALGDSIDPESAEAISEQHKLLSLLESRLQEILKEKENG